MIVLIKCLKLIMESKKLKEVYLSLAQSFCYTELNFTNASPFFFSGQIVLFSFLNELDSCYLCFSERNGFMSLKFFIIK